MKWGNAFRVLAIIFCAASLIIWFTACASTPKTDDSALSLNQKIDQLAGQLIKATDRAGEKKVAVLYFLGPNGRVTSLGEHLSDKLSVNLYQSGAFNQMLERKQLKQVVSAKTEELSGYFDLSTVHVYGQMIGVDSMVIGTIEDLGDSVDVTAKVVSSKTGRILGMADLNIVKTEAIETLLRPLSGTLTVQTQPAVDGTAVIGDRHVSIRNGTAKASNIPYGQTRISINVEGYESLCQTVSLNSSREIVTFALDHLKYSVSFQIHPPDATLRVDGEPYPLNEEGFAQIPDLSSETHSYLISAEGYKTKSAQFNPTQTSVITATLKTSDPFYRFSNSLFEKVKQAQAKQSFDVELWTNQRTFSLGEKVVFYFRSERDCYLNLISVNSRGDITLLFPNKYHRDNQIMAGQTYSIPDKHYPFEFEVQPPTGKDRIYAIAGDKPINIFDTNFSDTSFTSLTRGDTPDAGVRGLGVKIKHASLEAADDWVIEVRP